MKYASVIVDNNTNATDLIYTYGCEFDVRPGQRVKVPFSIHNRIIDGYVTAVSDEAPEKSFHLKYVKSVDEDFALSEEAMRTVFWMHNRYLCRYIEAINCFLPIADSKRKVKDPFENLELNPEDAQPKALNDEQASALDRIEKSLTSKEKKITMVFGVTGSGKTEVYLQAMKKIVDDGKQGIVLVPEISLTPQLLSRFVSRFGKEKVAVLHSKLTPTQRSEQYKRIRSGEAKLVIGARSAVFAPVSELGMIILDEEHEGSYKSDKSPKYDTVEVAAKRCMDHGALLVLGSATPTISDFYRSEKGIFDRIELKERFNKNPLPKVSVVDMTKELKAGNRSLFSRPLRAEMERCLSEKKQIILFLNRRGYSSHVSCRECGFVLSCEDCGIAMPYHKDANACVCHYCGKKKRMPARCPKCGSSVIGRYGAGTEQLEEKCSELFPEAEIERLDLDSIKKKGELESILGRFAKGKTNILIGTQLVVKGLDFANVGLVGIISADVSLNIPDFRSMERSFQLMDQAAGRSGRGDEQGRVIIQTYQPDSPAVVYAANHDYRSFYEYEIDVRKAAMYPPFADIIQLVFQNENERTALSCADTFARQLRKELPEDIRVLGPAASALTRQNSMFRYQILIKVPLGKRREVSEIVARLKKAHDEAKKPDGTLITVDINPFSYM